MTTEPPYTLDLLRDEKSSSPLLAWRRYHFPINWQSQFAPLDASDLHLEVGFGDGRYTVRRAQEEPKACYVGLEIASASIQRALKRIHREKVDNVYILKCGADFALHQLFAPHSLSSITVNFPDPWPKDRHEENRLLKQSFFKLATTRLKAGGQIRLATDHPEYLAFARSEALATELYDLQEATPPTAVFETKYALKWKGQGKPLFYQIFQVKRVHDAHYDSLERLSMPHAILKGSVPDKVAFEKQVLEYAGGHVILHEASQSWLDDAKGRLLIRATVDEADLRQQLLVMVKPRKENELLVGLESFGDPIITKSSRGAIHGVTEWLLSLGQGLEVIKRDY